MATFLKPDRPSGWQNQVYNGRERPTESGEDVPETSRRGARTDMHFPASCACAEYGREDMARMDPEERRAMIQRFSDSHTDGSNPDLNSYANRTHDIGGIFGSKSVACHARRQSAC